MEHLSQTAGRIVGRIIVWVRKRARAIKRWFVHHGRIGVLVTVAACVLMAAIVTELLVVGITAIISAGVPSDDEISLEIQPPREDGKWDLRQYPVEKPEKYAWNHQT
ncbi:hypothetical protein IJ118_00200 [Candidatus Saccharibacteria bacterium]|nr:hypothetical protein [Candidatus Saccharibacteria bacterium]